MLIGLSTIYVLVLALQYSFTDNGAFALPYRRDLVPDSALAVRSAGFELPISFTQSGLSEHERRGVVSGSTGTGNLADLLYTVPIKLGNVVVPVNLDTGSSDLWVVSDQCKTNACVQSTSVHFPSARLRPAGADIQMFYGDSTTGTHAFGKIGLETATIANIAMTNQPFGLIDDTTNLVVRFATSGIFGLGFPAGSKILEALVKKSGPLEKTDDFLASSGIDGPLLSRIALTNALQTPVFAISLQRTTIDVGGQGLLTVGKLPAGISASQVTWVPVRLYRPQDGGLPPPSFAPDEIYPFRWEVDIDGVFLDGKKLADSKIPTQNGVDSRRVSALLDTGNSLLRGPEDVVNSILSSVSTTFDPDSQRPLATLPCNVPRTLSFQIGGKMFPIDPRDFIGQATAGNAVTCQADNLVPTDAPASGALYRWSLGTPFFRSNTVIFHYGNLTHPSVDPPRIGIVSRVPSNANALLRSAVSSAVANGGNFPDIRQPPPTASAARASSQVTLTASAKPSFATRRAGRIAEPSGRPKDASGASSFRFRSQSASATATGASTLWSSPLFHLSILFSIGFLSSLYTYHL